MTMRTSNINAYGNSANTASDIKVDSQHIGGAAKKFDLTSKHHECNHSNNRSENNTTYITSNCTINYILPERAEPEFVSRELGLDGAKPATLWNEARRKFLNEDETIQVQEQSDKLWTKAQLSAQKLDKATSVFKYQYNDALDFDLDLQRTREKGIRFQLRRAREHHQRGFGVQSPTSSALYDLDKALGYYFKWLRRLENDELSSSLCDAIQSIIAAVENDDGVDDFIPQTVAISLQQFGHAKCYLMANRSHWTSQIEELTLYIFNLLAELLEKVMSAFVKRVLEDTKKEFQDYINRLHDNLRVINIMAKNRNAIPHQSSFKPSNNDNLVDMANCYTQFLSRDGRRSKDAGIGYQRGRKISHLLNLLAYSESDTAKDINTGQFHANVTRQQMQYLSGLTKRRSFQDWLTKRQSTALLINGNKRSFSRISPLSHFCAQMAEEYNGWQQFIFLSYFCGFFDKRQRDPGTMLCQMIGQLINIACKSSFVPGLSSPDDHYTKKIKGRDVKTLCKTFSFLIEQLKGCRIVVFCVIDSISTFEDSARRNDNETVIKTLLNIVRQKQTRGHKMMFKLMITDNKKSLYAWKHFEPHERVEMSESSRGSASTHLELSKEKR